MNKYRYNHKKSCIAKGKYIDEMVIKEDDSSKLVILRHVMDGKGEYTNYYHIYSSEEITEGMEFRKRRDGNIYYTRLNREDTIKLMGKQAVEF